MATTSFNTENILLKDKFSMKQLRGFQRLKIKFYVILYCNENRNCEANIVLLRAVHRYIQTLSNAFNNLL